MEQRELTRVTATGGGVRRPEAAGAAAMERAAGGSGESSLGSWRGTRAFWEENLNGRGNIYSAQTYRQWF
jgi:hypothetical protein